MFNTLLQQEEIVFGTTSYNNNNNNNNNNTSITPAPPQNVFTVEDLMSAGHPGDFQLDFGTASNIDTNIIPPPNDLFVLESDPITADPHGNFLLISNNTSFSNKTTTTTASTSIKEQTKFSSGKREAADDDIRKVMHREYERQRRQQMSTHLASLRSLLPYEQVKGKRSLNDHMEEAVNYIKKMERNVEELRIRRDKLRSALAINSESSTFVRERSTTPNCVTVNSDSNGNTTEILISCNTEDSEFRLSDVTEELTGREIDVVSCVCTRNTKNGVFLYTIHAAPSDGSFMDVSTLQERLRELINQRD